MVKYKFMNAPARRKRAYVSLTGATTLHLRNPYVIAAWSMAFPGLGHLLLSKYIRGFLLFLWEVFINYQSHVNLAILYSLVGKFGMAKDIVNTKWSLLYIPTYIFAIYDSYETTVDINNNYILATREDAEVLPFKVGAMEINFLDKKTPWVAAAWSLLSPGAGQLYIHRIVVAAFILIWVVAISYLSNLLPAIQYSLLGQVDKAKSIIDWQWYLNIPSIYVYAMYDAYTNCVEGNNLYDWEQSKFLKRNYQNKKFHIPDKESLSRGGSLYIISTFDYSVNLELAITSVEMEGVEKEKIFAIPVDKENEKLSLFDSIHHSDSRSLMDLASILGTLFMIFGSIYGFVLKWGPVWWGAIGLVVGFSVGLFIKFLFLKKYSKKKKTKHESEVVIIIECKESIVEAVVDILWSNHALGVSKLNHSNISS